MEWNSMVISGIEALHKARQLLYDCYVKKLQWEIVADNPSGIRMETRDNALAIVDDYDSCSTWFSVTQEKETVACARICKEDTKGRLEVERYASARLSLRPVLNLKHALKLVELNREAMATHCIANKTIGFSLLRAIFTYCLEHDYTVLTTTPITEWVELYEDIGFPKLETCAFKYFHLDPCPVAVYFAQHIDMQRMLQKIDTLMHSKEKSYAETLCFSG